MNFLKNFIGEQTEEAMAVPEGQWAKIEKERQAHEAGSASHTWSEVKAMARDKEKRHGLSSGD